MTSVSAASSYLISVPQRQNQIIATRVTTARTKLILRDNYPITTAKDRLVRIPKMLGKMLIIVPRVKPTSACHNLVGCAIHEARWSRGSTIMIGK